MNTLKVKKLHPDAILPRRAHTGDAGLDLYATEDMGFDSNVRLAQEVRTGIAIELPPGTMALLAERSSIAKSGLKVMGGIIDAGYRGEITVPLMNLSAEHRKVKKGDRIAQLVIFPIMLPTPILVEELDETDRGTGAFGSTGK